MDFRSQVIKLAHEVPELRKHLVPLIRKTAYVSDREAQDAIYEVLDKLLEKSPNGEVSVAAIARVVNQKLPGAGVSPADVAGAVDAASGYRRLGNKVMER